MAALGIEAIANDSVSLILPGLFVGQLLDGLDVLIEQWDYTADYLEHGAFRDDMMIRECSKSEEARWIAGFYREIAASISRQRAEQAKPSLR